jgi:hypothetical protein
MMPSKRHWIAARRPAQRRRGLDRAGIGRPRRENGALFGKRQIGIVDDIVRVRKGLRGMQERIEIVLVAWLGRACRHWTSGIAMH